MNMTSSQMKTPEDAAYMDSLSEKERKALEIAKEHLSTLFNLHKTNGYIAWKKKQEEEKTR
jgi:hypothetical protein